MANIITHLTILTGKINGIMYAYETKTAFGRFFNAIKEAFIPMDMG